MQHTFTTIIKKKKNNNNFKVTNLQSLVSMYINKKPKIVTLNEDYCLFQKQQKHLTINI